MTLGLRDSRSRRRRQLRWRIIKVVFFLAAALAAGVVAYQGGSLLARQEVIQLETHVTELEDDVIALQRQNDDLLAAAQDAKARESEWRERYHAEVPTGEAKALFDQLQTRLADGIATERMAFVIGAATTPRDCEETSETKRFVVQTPYTPGTNGAVGFDRQTVVVTAAGEAATSASGNVESWFDPTKPITARFAAIGGETTESTGTLPLQHAMVIGDQEYRFSILTGDKRGFVRISRSRCPYP